MEPTTLTTDRLVLRPFAPSDEDEVYAAAQDPDIQRFTLVPSPYEREHARTFVNELVPTGWREDTAYSFAVRLGAEGPLVAAVGVHVHEVFGNRAYEIGYWATKEHRGNGYMAEAVRAVAGWAFTELGAARLEWRADVDNPGSWAVARKAGFQLEGTLRAGMQGRDTMLDCRIAGLLPTDLGLPSRVPYVPSASA
ncbi:GNAT family N-acetyltransferase [Streptomyces sp. NPDC091371]|uniref:GNAT family N-acetyltransferase n=1 Tax=Streptomyces sp. NPDC091371 TaxID=3155303 RepID=UPI00343C7FB3